MVTKQQQTALDRLCDKELATLLEPIIRPTLARMIRLSRSKNEDVSFKACRDILDRGLGKPAQNIKVGNLNNEPLKVSWETTSVISNNTVPTPSGTITVAPEQATV